MRRSSTLLAAATAALLGGCVVPGLPPPMSLARVAHLPATTGTHPLGKVSATTGLMGSGGAAINDTAYFAFDGEASLSLWLAPRYDLTVTSTGWVTAVEGNAILDTGPLRVGLLHGLGLAFYTDKTGTLFFVEGTGGVDLQVPTRHGALLFAGRVSYSTVSVGGGASGGGISTAVEPYVEIGASVAWTRRLAGFEVTPELAILRGLPTSPSLGGPEWYTALLVTVSAPFPGPAKK